MASSQPDRYEPLPSIPALPGWIWRRLPPAGKVVVALLPFAALALALALAPGIEESKEERAQAERERIARARAARDERIRVQQRPRFGSAAPAPADLAGRERLVDAAARSVRTDARARVATGELDGPIRRVECEPFPRTVSGIGAHQSLDSRFGRYACIAVTAEFEGNELSEASIIGHPYRVRIDFDTGKYAFCKFSGRAGEGSLSSRPPVRVPHVCGGT